ELCRRDLFSTVARPGFPPARQGFALLCKTLQALAIRHRRGESSPADRTPTTTRGIAMTQQPTAGRPTARPRRPVGVQGANRRLQSTPVTTRLADIAAQAGVSEAPVSRVLNGKPGVAATTRQSVLAALDVLGYERPVRLRQRSEGLVGLITPELGNRSEERRVGTG